MSAGTLIGDHDQRVTVSLPLGAQEQNSLRTK